VGGLQFDGAMGEGSGVSFIQALALTDDPVWEGWPYSAGKEGESNLPVGANSPVIVMYHGADLEVGKRRGFNAVKEKGGERTVEKLVEGIFKGNDKSLGCADNLRRVEVGGGGGLS